MAKSKRTPRERIERAFHVSFMLPGQAGDLLDDYAAQVRYTVLTEAAEMLRTVNVSPNETDGVDAAADLILATRDREQG
ncbi:hypothetical protein [Kitasatospora sp. NPDC047058]|uniref:hypothetical protein n=1 Tax=Kitasatospora sp. NPDC047058 TaxID=3155620 RepID=UPI0033CA32AB